MIEGMATSIMLLGVLLLVVYIGVAYYNASVMNTATQNIALNAETQMDHFCKSGASNERCATATGETGPLVSGDVNGAMIATPDGTIPSISAAITNEAAKNLALVSDPETSTSTHYILHRPGQVGASSAPVGVTSWPSCPGWGYSQITMTVPLTMFTSQASVIPVLPAGAKYTSKALGFSYDRPNTLGAGASC